MVCYLLVLFREDHQLEGRFMSSDYVVDQEVENNDFNDTVSSIGECLIREEQKQGYSNEVSNEEHYAQLYRVVLVDHNSHDIRTSGTASETDDQTQSRSLQSTGDNRNKQRVLDIEELAWSTLEPGDAGDNLHRHRRHQDSIYSLESEADSHRKDSDDDQDDIDSHIGKLSGNQASGRILDDGRKTHHSSSGHTPWNHETFPGPAEDKAGQGDDKILVDG